MSRSACWYNPVDCLTSKKQNIFSSHTQKWVFYTIDFYANLCNNILGIEYTKAKGVLY